MYLSKHDQRILSMLIEQRDKLTSQPKAYRHSDSVQKLTNSIVAIKNTAVYSAMPESSVDYTVQAGKTVLMNKGDTISLRVW